MKFGTMNSGDGKKPSRRERGNRKEQSESDSTKEVSVAENKPSDRTLAPGMRGQLGAASAIVETDYFLPVSKRTIKLRQIEVDPDVCDLHPANPRIQEMLNLDDPKLQEMYQNIMEQKQREPVLIRSSESDSEKSTSNPFELIIGSTRRYIVSELNKNELKEAPRQLIAWKGEIPDIDAEFLAAEENKFRRKESAYEKAVATKNKVEALITNGETVENAKAIVAKKSELSVSAVEKHRKLASLPLNFVLLLASVKELKVREGTALLSLIEKYEAEVGSSPIKKLKAKLPKGRARFSDIAEMVSVLNQLMPKAEEEPEDPKAKYSDRSPTKFDSLSIGKTSISKNRKNHKKFKIDIGDASEEQISLIEDFIKKEFELKP